MQLRPHHTGKKYLNAVSTRVSPPSGYGALLKRFVLGKEEREPKAPLGPFRADAAALAAPVPPDALRVTWLGHSTALLELDGRRILTGPVWAERASPSQLFGPKRFFALPLAQAPPLDAVLLSHDHYDHLDEATIRSLGKTGVPFFCPWAWGRTCAAGACPLPASPSSTGGIRPPWGPT
ncbi:MAG TPA: MBL fold metallo-hydrolase [Hymenobacter sp.]